MKNTLVNQQKPPLGSNGIEKPYHTQVDIVIGRERNEMISLNPYTSWITRDISEKESQKAKHGRQAL